MKSLRCLVWLLPLVLFVACNKTDRYNSTFVNGHSWKVFDDGATVNADVATSCLVIDETSFSNGEEFGDAIWKHLDGSEQKVTWRFWRNAATFEFWHIGPLDEMSKASLQSYYRSGIYEVRDLTKKQFTIESEDTKGYQGKLFQMTFLRK